MFIRSRFALRWTGVVVICVGLGSTCAPPDGGGIIDDLLGTPQIYLEPTEQDIPDGGYALLHATHSNLPQSDETHEPTILRWRVLSGGGTLGRVGTGDVNVESNPVLETLPELSDFGNVAAYFPDAGATGEARIQVEAITQIVRRNVVQPDGSVRDEHDEEVVASATAIVRVNDELRLRLTPEQTGLPGGGTVTLTARFLNRTFDDFTAANAVLAGALGLAQPQPTVQYEWDSDGPAGAGSLSGNTPDSNTVTFTAGVERATFVISVRTTETFPDGSIRINGPARAVVHVDPDLETVTTFGYYLTRIENTWDIGAEVVGWMYFPRVPGAISYSVRADGITDFTNAFGPTHSWSFSPDSSGQLHGAQDAGGAYRVGLSSWAGSWGGVNGAFNWLQGRFSGMRVQVSAVVRR